MSRVLELVAPVFVSVVAIGCGPSEVKPPASPPVVPGVASSSALPAAPVEDRSPVERPKGHFATIHSSSPAALKRWLSKRWPSSVDAEWWFTHPYDDDLMKLVDLDKPVDIAFVALREKDSQNELFGALHAFSVRDGIDVDAVLGNERHAELRADGVRVVARKKAAPGDPQCLIVPAIGPSKYRLVCDEPHVSTGGAVFRYAPWLARGITKAEGGTTSAWLDVDLAEARTAFRKQIDRIKPVLRDEFVGAVRLPKHPAVEAVAKRVAGNAFDDAFELLEEAQGARLTGTFDDDAAKVALAAKLSSMHSWSARVLLAGADGKAVPPLFAKSTADGWLAAFSRGTPSMDECMHPVEKTAVDLVEAISSDLKWTKKDRNGALDVVKLLFPASADTVVVAGEDPSKKFDWDDPAAVLLQSALGGASWSVTSMARPAKTSIEQAKSLAAFLTRPSVLGLVKSFTHDQWSLSLTHKETAAPKELPKGTYAHAWDVTVKAKTKTIVHATAQEIVAPDGDAHSVVGNGRNLGTAQLVTRMLEAMQGKAPSTYGARPDLAYLTESRASDGVAIALDTLIRIFAPLADAKPGELSAKLPGGGKGSLMMRVVSSSSGNGGEVEIGAAIPSDVFSLFLALLQGESQ